MVFRKIYVPLLLLFIILQTACKEEPEQLEDQDIVLTVDHTLNPSFVSPLTANIRVTTNRNAELTVTILGKEGSSADFVQEFSDFNTVFDVTIVGLYGDYDNQLELSFHDASGEIIDVEPLSILTGPLSKDLPQIRIDLVERDRMQDGFSLVNYFGHDSEFLPQRPFMFDSYGNIRWYLDFTNHVELGSLFYDNGLVQLANNNFIFGNGNSDKLYEIDKYGKLLNEWDMHGYEFHHHIFEIPNGNFLVTVNDPSKATIEDVVIELGRGSNSLVNVWDLNNSLDKNRRAWDSDIADLNVDWIHANGITYDPVDDAIIVSGRTQGVVKLNRDNEVVWILAPHKGWEESGNGLDLKQYLLTPLDASGEAITDKSYLDGSQTHPDFEWAWYQHSPILLPSGNVMIFDNGDNRNYIHTGVNTPGSYSRAVEYEIDEGNMTIKQVWQYGKERGLETYSRIVSKVLHYEDTGNILFTPGAVKFNGENYGKVIEVDKGGGLIFEATITPPIPVFNITFHNVHRVEI